ncbi:uncharacterized protein LOC132301214 [Cornus florida]|uniref:uncharacterized protein LOC132301214 n=1 Tax=Cornus florida TaxID=4283 RepID=UPI00289E5CC8|nr:uncharacterized protein LOC132301214 [Cornus florida]XP_059654477.1 uncharacterized protein LOC132301214 [Cornus florida]
MDEKEDGDFFRSLRKKELQELCKKYGLSPYKTKPNLVDSLNSYFEKKKLSSLSTVGRSNCHSTSLVPQLQFGAQSIGMVVDTKRDNGGIITCSRKEDNRENNCTTVKCNGIGSCMDVETHAKASGNEVSEDSGCYMYDMREASHSGKNNLAFLRETGMGNMPQIQRRNVDLGANSAENASTSSIKSSKALPSFEFYVRSAEGINLFVDLNSSPSDWSRRFENEVCMFQNENKFQSFREELEQLGNSQKQTSTFLQNTDSDHEINNGHVIIKSSLNSIIRGNGHVEFDHPDGDDETLGATAIKPHSDATETSSPLEGKKELLLLSRLNSDATVQMISGMESCLGDEETKPLDSNVPDTPQTKLVRNSGVSLTSDAPESLNTLEHQNPKLGDENCESLMFQNSSPANANAVPAGCSGICSVEMQLSEAASHRKDASYSSCENNSSAYLVDTMHNMETRDGGLANPNEVNQDSSSNHMPAHADVLERNDLIRGMETSECLGFNKCSEERSKDWLSDDGPKRKSQDGKYQADYSQPERKILRSSKRLSGEVLPRRSMRLVSK